jgi:TPP-dependent pyruvate/acetoin dehydrogenase alpha subunit
MVVMKMTLSPDTLEHMYRTMWTIRRFEETAGKLYQKGVIKGGIHASIGQEGVAVGVCTALRPDDWITSTHRGHGHHIAKGADLGRLMAEIMGKDTGYCRGRGGSMHVAAFDVGSLGASAIVAAGVPMGVGAALSARMQDRDRVVVSFFGDGAMGQGTLHESLNLAAVWKLPILFLFENNQFAVSTRVDQSIAVKDRQALAGAYGLANACVDGQDVLAVYDAVYAAVELARGGGGPSFVECQTYRFEGHYFGEPQVYRTREEVEEARRSRDSISRFGAVLVAEQGIPEEELHTLEAQASQAVEEALAFAQESPEPPAEAYKEFVYA